jgi:energy-coupling factor transporter transmembrane protein EcfT
MDSEAIMIILMLLFVGTVCGLIWLILLIIGCVKKSKKRIILSFIPVGVFAVIAGGIFAYDAVKRHEFEEIPCLETKNDTVTILMSIYKALNPNFHYVLAEEDEKGNIVVRNTERNTEKFIGNFFMTSDESILTETDNPFHMNHGMTKNGYTFKVNKPGTAYVCIFVRENGHYVFLEIYKVIADDNMDVTVDNFKHIECDDKFGEELPEKFSFLTEVFDELNKK